jgi:3-hydroxyacyl-CoA dehydrogenase
MTELSSSVLSSSVSIERHGSIDVITVNNPPVNALSSHVRQGLFDGFTQASAGDATAIVLFCAGRTFIAGADITEFGGGAASAASLLDVQDVMENATKPVVAAIHGTALGGGLEVALCAHFRVATPDAKLGLPEVKLGLLPGAGGTQRLPRVVGVAKALEMMTTGDPISAADALGFGLVDEVAEAGSDLLSTALAFAGRVAADGRPLTRIRDRQERIGDPAEADALIAAARKQVSTKQRGFLAPQHNIACIEAAVHLPFEQGIARERELFMELMMGGQSAAQRYAFFAERAANKIPDIPADTPLLPIGKVGVLGAGTMGGGIAMNFANVGIPVTIVERDQAALEKGLGVIRSNYERSVSRGSLAASELEVRLSRITGSLDKSSFADCDLVIEAVFEDMALKKSVFAELDTICKPGAIMATNTSALDVNEIASATSRPESVIGLHFFSPANVMKMLEIVRGRASSPSVVATSMALSKTIKKVGVLVGVCHGFVGNRMLFQRGIEANQMILEGATPAQVDRVLYEFGFAMGPFQMSDLAGLDIGWKAETSTGSTIRELMCESGRRGQKNGRGYYTYDPTTRAGTADPEVEQMIKDFAAGKGIEQREVTDQEVLERLLYPMVNEGAKILEEGMALRGSDIDVVWVNGYGWPLYRGGPMFWADSLGLANVVASMEAYSARLGGRHWEVSPLLRRMAESGGTLQAATPAS